jgi:hypothetical protein
MGVSMKTYEVRFCRGDGTLSVIFFDNFTSDKYAISASRLLLHEGLPIAEVRCEGEMVAELSWMRPHLAA